MPQVEWLIHNGNPLLTGAWEVKIKVLGDWVSGEGPLPGS